MPEDSTNPANSPAPQPSVDGVASAPPAPSARASTSGIAPETVAQAKRKVLSLGMVGYVAYALWCGALVVLLPSQSGEFQWMVQVGLITCLVGGATFLLLGFFLLNRIARADAPIAARQVGLLKLGLAIVPGILLSAIVPFFIMGEPKLALAISPSSSQELVAPVSISISAEAASAVLQKLGHRVIQYDWDTSGDGKKDETTIVPISVALFERPGNYTVTVTLTLADGSTRKITRRIAIPVAVFTVTPARPIVEKPVRFSVRPLLTDVKLLSEVEWDLDGNGETDETTKEPDILHTYYAVGPVTVSATVRLTTNTKQTYKKVIQVEEPPPLPFPVTLTTDPKNLIGPVPFGVIFTVETGENIREIEWDFGDGKEERGANLTRIGHAYDTPGIYSVVTKIRSASGELAELTSLVRAAQTLQLPDLRFDGTPDVKSQTVRGEVPLTVQLTPKTSLPLVQFFWEAPEATNVQVTGQTLQAIYRREGEYTITLLAQGPEGKAMRYPISVVVSPPAAEPSIEMRPESGEAPLRVSFDASNTFLPAGEQIAGFKWNFGDDRANAVELGAVRVEHTYQQPGEYEIVLIVVMASGKEFSAKRTIVVRRPTLDACLTASRTTVSVGGGVKFDTSCSAGNPASVLWDVRDTEDPSVSVAQSPSSTYVHVFDAIGTYTVTLTLGDKAGYTDTDSVTITVVP